MVLEKITLAFVLTYFVYMFTHSLRTTYSFSKITLEDPVDGIGITKKLESYVEVIFMVSLGIGKIVVGSLSNRYPKTLFLTFGQLITAIAFVSIPIFYNILATKHIIILMVCMCINGIGQSIPVPICAGIIQKSMGSQKNKFIPILWFTCTNLGNIWGLISSTLLYHESHSWKYSYLLNSLLLLLCTAIFTVFIQQQDKPKIQEVQSKDDEQALSLCDALAMPHVIQYLIGNSFLKGAYYGLSFWLPKYIHLQNIGVGTAGYIPSMLDIGCICGSIFIAYCTDRWLSFAQTITIALYVSLSALIIPQLISHLGAVPYVIIAFVIGFTMNGAYNVITFSLGITLGAMPEYRNKKNANMVVTGLIDGVATLFTAMTLFAIGYLPLSYIFMLFFSYALISACLLSKVCYEEYSKSSEQSTALPIVD